MTLTGLDEDTLGRLRARAAEHGKSDVSEAVDILKAALPAAAPTEEEWVGSPEYLRRVKAMEEMAAFRRETVGRGSQSSVELLRESREMRMRQLLGESWDD